MFASTFERTLTVKIWSRVLFLTHCFALLSFPSFVSSLACPAAASIVMEGTAVMSVLMDIRPGREPSPGSLASLCPFRFVPCCPCWWSSLQMPKDLFSEFPPRCPVQVSGLWPAPGGWRRPLLAGRPEKGRRDGSSSRRTRDGRGLWPGRRSEVLFF